MPHWTKLRDGDDGVDGDEGLCWPEARWVEANTLEDSLKTEGSFTSLRSRMDRIEAGEPAWEVLDDDVWPIASQLRLVFGMNPIDAAVVDLVRFPWSRHRAEWARHAPRIYDLMQLYFDNKADTIMSFRLLPSQDQACGDASLRFNNGSCSFDVKIQVFSASGYELDGGGVGFASSMKGKADDVYSLLDGVNTDGLVRSS